MGDPHPTGGYPDPKLWVCAPLSFELVFQISTVGRTPKGAYSSRGRSRHLLETAFSEPLLRTLLRTLSYCKTHSRPPSQNPSENPFPRTLPRTLPKTFSEPFLECCVAVRPLRRAPYTGSRTERDRVYGEWIAMTNVGQPAFIRKGKVP